MFRHVVMVRWKPEATLDQRTAALSGVQSLPQRIPQIRRLTIDRNAAIDKDTFDVVVVVDFADANDYVVYRDHPDHRALMETVLRPILAARAAIEHEVR